MVAILGLSASSSASDGKTKAQQALAQQQQHTTTAQGCERQLRANLSTVVADGQALLASVAQEGPEDAAVVAAIHDELTNGTASNIDGYNAAIDRNNAAVAAANRLRGGLNLQLSKFRTDAEQTPAGCHQRQPGTESSPSASRSGRWPVVPPTAPDGEGTTVKKGLTAAAAVLTLSGLLAACGGGGSSVSSKKPTKTTAAASGSTAPAANATVKVASSSLGMILVDANGKTLYEFDKDMGTTSNCSGACAQLWPALTATGMPVAGSGIDQTKLTIVSGPNGQQVAYNGHLLYTFAQDMAPGDVKGQGFAGNIWHVVSPAGDVVMTSAPAARTGATGSTSGPTTSPSTSSKSGSGSGSSGGYGY